uniref:C-type lectin domain-containing protein n=1 Tax=Chelydra serpentina TaxID=8475 RepID=A0A8C3XNY7_CHESE
MALGPLTAVSCPHHCPRPPLSAGVQAAFCPTGWLHFQDNCYGYFFQEKTWPDAEAECQRYWQGAHLVSIHSAGENNMMAHYIKQYHRKKSPIWIGLPGGVRDPPDRLRKGQFLGLAGTGRLQIPPSHRGFITYSSK